jgi:hypothetical protein
MLENRIEMLSQAAAILADTSRFPGHLSNRETLPISAQYS